MVSCYAIFLLPYIKLSPLKPLCGVGSGGLEPPTSRLSGVCSNQLSYKPFITNVVAVSSSHKEQVRLLHNILLHYHHHRHYETSSVKAESTKKRETRTKG